MKYRWKYRVCCDCRQRLRTRCYVSGLGQQVIAGLEPAGGRCGSILLEGEQLPPPASKWQTVVLPARAVMMRSADAREIGIKRAAQGKWVSLEVDDIFKFAKRDFKRTVEARAIGPIISGARVMVSARTDYNAFKAVAARVFRPVPPPEPGIWRFAATFKFLLCPCWGKFPSEQDWDTWIRSMPPERQKPLREAKALYDRTGWLSAYEKFHAFVKCELLPYFGKSEDGLKALDAMIDRLINAPHDVTHVIAGRKIKPFMSWLKEQWHHQNHLFYASVEPLKLQQWLDRVTGGSAKTIFWSDYTLFDASHNDDTWDFVESLYVDHLGDPDFRRVLQVLRKPGGTIRNLRYQAKVMNASGRPDTALANAFLNGFAMLLSACAAWFGVDLRHVDHKLLLEFTPFVQLAVCGDDALGFLPEMSEAARLRFLQDLRANLARFGFIAKAFASDRYEDAVFLGHRPLPIGGRWYWTRTLGRCLYKLGWQLGVRGDGGAVMHGIMDMHRRCSAHTPVLAEIANAYVRNSQGMKLTMITEDVHKPWEWMGRFGPSNYDDSTIQALARVYTVSRTRCRTDLSPTDTYVSEQDVRDLCRYVDETVTSQPCVLDHWLLKHMVWVDEQ